MVVVSISKSCHLRPACKKRGGGAWELEGTEESWVSSRFLEIIRTRLLCCGAGTGVGGLAEVTNTAAKATAGRQCRHLGKLCSIPPPPSAMSARAGSTLGPSRGPWLLRPAVRMVEATLELNPTQKFLQCLPELEHRPLGKRRRAAEPWPLISRTRRRC